MKRLLFVAAVALVFWKHERLQHLAVPVLTKPQELPAAAPVGIAEAPALETELVATFPSRVTALLETSDGALWTGTFDRCVFRGERQLGGEGRQCFVNALVEHDGRVWAATYGGVLEYRLDGTLERVHLPGVSAEALVVHDGRLVLGTVRGLFASGRSSASFDGPLTPAPLRVSALSVSNGRLWIGTPSGVYEGDGTWHPLVFGPEASQTNVVLALAPWKDGVLALTDNGGVVDVQPGREVKAYRFLEPRANEGNPGALLASGGAVLVGTQGGGLLSFSDGVQRPRGWSAAIVSALAPGLIGDGDGRVLRVSRSTVVHTAAR